MAVSLFQRLEQARDDGMTGGQPLDRHAVSESVLANVRDILNARQGCCEARRDFGMPDLNDLAQGGAGTVSTIARAVRRQLELFEPRLAGIAVRALVEEMRPGEFAFAVSARIELDGDEAPIRFDTLVGAHQRPRVRS